MKWSEVNAAAHGARARVRVVRPLEPGMSIRRQLEHRVDVDIYEGVIRYPTHGTLSATLTTLDGKSWYFPHDSLVELLT